MNSTLESLVPVTTCSALSGSIVAALMSTAWPGFLMRLTWIKSYLAYLALKPLLHLQEKHWSRMLTRLSAPSTLPSYQMGATSMMLHLQRRTPTSVTYLIQKWRTSTEIWLTSLPPASDSPAAQQPTTYALAMANRNAGLAIQILFNQKQFLLLKASLWTIMKVQLALALLESMQVSV